MDYLHENRVGGYAKTCCKSLACLVFVSASLQLEVAQADTLTVSPITCAKLNKNLLCEKDITIQWKADKRGDYCIFAGELSVPIDCWEASSQGLTRYLFKSDKSLAFFLVNTKADLQAGQEKVKARALFKVAEVYSSNRWAKFFSFFFR